MREDLILSRVFGLFSIYLGSSVLFFLFGRLALSGVFITAAATRVLFGNYGRKLMQCFGKIGFMSSGETGNNFVKQDMGEENRITHIQRNISRKYHARTSYPLE